MLLAAVVVYAGEVSIAVLGYFLIITRKEREHASCCESTFWRNVFTSLEMFVSC